MKNSTTEYQNAIEANIAVHSAMADDYNTVEPHFRPESINRVTNYIKKIHDTTKFEKVLDLGCGTGFMIDIVKPYSTEILGVDVTQAMLDKVNTEGLAKITLINSDTANVVLPENYYDLATAYTFLDHLYDMVPTFKNCYKSLKPGGVFYADLSPNAYFWDEIKKLNPNKHYNPVLDREIKAINFKDKEIEQNFGVSSDVFIQAEFQKHVKGGLREESLKEQLEQVGFKNIEFIYHWFIGQAQIINNPDSSINEKTAQAQLIHNCLTEVLPISRSLFKYVGFIAYK
jgi:ubiquinone/menaquinone biosynthesis C-methylase UbiE